MRCLVRSLLVSTLGNRYKVRSTLFANCYHPRRFISFSHSNHHLCLADIGCSKSHLPSFITAQDELKAKGVEMTICIATNDAYVMEVSVVCSLSRTKCYVLCTESEADNISSTIRNK